MHRWSLAVSLYSSTSLILTTTSPAAYYFPPSGSTDIFVVSHGIITFSCSHSCSRETSVRSSAFGHPVLSVGRSAKRKITVRFRRHSRYHFVLSHLPLLPKLRLNSSVQGVHLTPCCCLQHGNQQHFLAVNQHSYLFFFSFWPALAQLERANWPLGVETNSNQWTRRQH
jgi:hypothetical protein